MKSGFASDWSSDVCSSDLHTQSGNKARYLMKMNDEATERMMMGVATVAVGSETEEDDGEELGASGQAEVDEDELSAHDTLQTQLTVSINLHTQRMCPFFSAIIEYLQTGLVPRTKEEARRIIFQADNFYIENDQLWHMAVVRSKRLNQIRPAYPQLCVPPQFREQILEAYHNWSHVGFLKTYLTIKQNYYWPGQSTDVQMFIQTCTTCQKIKTDVSTKPLPLTSMPIRRLFECAHIDFHEVRVANAPHPYKHILIITDSLSLNTELCAAKSTTAEEAAQLFYENWICRYGCPNFLVSDRGK
jgi:hypothetical protein